MPYAWPEDTDFALWELDVLDRDAPVHGPNLLCSKLVISEL
jgi:hypothetical protein